MSQSTENTGENDSDANKEQEEHLKTLGTAASTKKHDAKESGLVSPMLITVLLALPVAAVIAYVFMPDEFNEVVAMVTPDSSEVSESRDSTGMQNSSNQAAVNQGFVPVAPGTQAGATNLAVNNQNQQQAWADKQRAEFEQRRAEFEKRRAQNYGDQWASSTPPEPPQWVKDRQAEMEKQRLEMEKQREQYMKEMAEQQAKWTQNNGFNQPSMYQQGMNPQSMNQPPMYQQGMNPQAMNQQGMNQQGMNRAPVNPYQQQAVVNRPPQQMQQPPVQQYGQHPRYNPYNQPMQQYYPAPAYNYGPYGRPYGYPGYGYR